MRDGTSSHGVVAADAVILIGYNKRAAGSAQLVDHGPPLEPLVKYGLAALEFIQPMGADKWHRRIKLQVQTLAVAQGALTAMSRSSPGLWVGGASSSSVN